ncbi:hypothetical protein [Streptomonospora wellingtoniae]|uniref:Uncharacterized protein n=1 Tax=Streptomonospora wellingtoniae TaxID=3075544 RepID=A0ABU2KUA2_9ACTN|nr:hypothetical protein [Streptomonospora sp. DSM 45055]MDT0302648.1 hypothetical protein [Streptomonospora sp. DSM 45055]
MASSIPTAESRPSATEPARPGRAVTATAVLTALACAGFALVNVVFEATDRFSAGPYADYAAGLAVMNWLVVGLKIVGAGMALLSVAPERRWAPAPLLAVPLWAAFATLGVYGLGSLVQALGLAAGITGSPDRIGAAGAAYVLFFLLSAVGFGTLALSHTRRHRVRARVAVAGSLGAPLVLGGVFMGIPGLLVALGVMPPM